MSAPPPRPGELRPASRMTARPADPAGIAGHRQKIPHVAVPAGWDSVIYKNERDFQDERRRQRRSQPLAIRLRAGVLAAALAGIVPFAAACGASSGSAAGLLNLQTMTAKALSYSKCMRSHGITNFPDPTVQNSATAKGVGFSLAGIDTHSPQFQSADRACQKLTGFGHVSPAMLQQAMNTLLAYAECMRSHGITNFPDPVESSTGVHIGPGPDSGINQNSPQYKAADKACRPTLPGGGP